MQDTFHLSGILLDVLNSGTDLVITAASSVSVTSRDQNGATPPFVKPHGFTGVVASGGGMYLLTNFRVVNHNTFYFWSFTDLF